MPATSTTESRTLFEVQHMVKPKDAPAPRWFHIAVAASMVISAISALVATLHTAKTMTALVEQNAKLVRAGSTPVLQFGHGNQRENGSRSLQFGVGNVGSGIARVVWFELRVDGKVMPDMSATVSALNPNFVVPEKIPLDFVTSRLAKNTLAPGAQQQVLGWDRPDEKEVEPLKAWEVLNKARFKRITVEACYCSVFQECWTSSLNGDVPKSVPECSAAGHLSFQG
jgi:hypothetical protein